MSMPSYFKLTEYRADQPFTVLIPPFTVLLKDGETTATIYPIHSADQLPPGLLAFLADEFNMEIERGDTFPYFETLDIEDFRKLWFDSFAAVMVLGEDPQLDHQRQWEKECLGTFHIRPNFPGRSSHISTGGFLVNAGIRGKGIGRTLVDCYLDWAPKLGYTSSMFNLVFESNVGARKIFEGLNFKRIGKIKAAGILKQHESAVDAFIYGKELVQAVEPSHATYRFDKIKYYLETGRYPPLIDRQEKSRLRSSAAHYKVINGKLMLNGREVISDPVKQLEICTDYHNVSHGGINKTTAAITERFHWARIKDTVAQAIRNCTTCRDPTKGMRRKKEPMPEHVKHAALQAATAAASSEALLHRTTHDNTTGEHTQSGQEYDGMVNNGLSSHSHRSQENLLHSDLAGLDIPSSILAAVENSQRMHQEEQVSQHQHRSHQHQPTSSSHSHSQHHTPQSEGETSHSQSHLQNFAEELASRTAHGHRTSQTTSSTGQSQGQSSSAQSSTQAQTQPSTQSQRLQFMDPHHTDQSHPMMHHNLQGDNDIPVDPEVSAFDTQEQGGQEIEIARALISANNEEAEQDADGDEALF